jgi:rfaE bifunctional protein kinase chain/domain
MLDVESIIYEKFGFLSRSRLEEILDRFDEVTMAVVGDGSLDVYWEADMTRSQLSRETPHFPLPIVKERLSLGAGANVVANLAALGLKRVGFLTVIGQDWRGQELKRLLAQQGIDGSFVLEVEGRVTPAYCKPIRHGYGDIWYEDPRLDFESTASLDSATEKMVAEGLRGIAETYQGLIVADQLKNGIITDDIRGELSRLGREHAIAVDSRERIHLFRNVIIKPNHVEVLQAVGSDLKPEEADKDDLISAGIKLSQISSGPVLITAGELGALWVEGEHRILEVATKPAAPPIDPVGAGDSFIAAFMASRLAGARTEEAMFIANLAARVVVKKLKITGTASQGELLEEYLQVSREFAS